MSTTPTPTPEEIEAARQLVAEADAAEAAAARATNLAAVAPLTAVGLGTSEPIGVTVEALLAAIQGQVAAIAATGDDTLMTLLSSTSRCLRTLDDRVRSIVVANQPAE